MICPSETPEGASVGLVKNLALLANISIATPSEPVRRAVVELGLTLFVPPSDSERIDPCVGSPKVNALSQFANGATRVFINGEIVGTHTDPASLVDGLRKFKRSGALSVFTSIVWDVRLRSLSLCTEGGRFLRPLLVMEPDGLGGARMAMSAELQARMMTAPESVRWMEDLVLSGAIEYMDVEETNTALISMTLPDAMTCLRGIPTHMEVSPSAMLGVVAGSIPYSDHNQAPRNTYQVWPTLPSCPAPFPFQCSLHPPLTHSFDALRSRPWESRRSACPPPTFGTASTPCPTC